MIWDHLAFALLVLQQHGALPLQAPDDGDAEFELADKADIGWAEEDEVFDREIARC